jgi:hypothetical protein
MTKICFMLIAAFVFNVITAVKGQINLVPNYDFEQFDSCPDNEDQIERSIGWQKFSESISTPDYYNVCDQGGYYNVPQSGNGYQEDHRNCSAFAGLVTFATPVANYREHIGIQLIQPLIIGQKYFLSFYTVMVEENLGGYSFGMPANNIGLRLSTVPYSSSSPCPIDNWAHIHSTNVINDSINWNRISGSLIADSTYNYIIIGNFFDDLNTDTLHYTCGTCLNYNSYYYVDDVCLSTDSILCNGGIDNIPCNVGISEYIPEMEVSVLPNPTTELLRIKFNEKLKGDINLIDFMGNTILKSVIFDKMDYTLNISSVSSGYYILQIVNKRNGKLSIKKILKI